MTRTRRNLVRTLVQSLVCCLLLLAGAPRHLQAQGIPIVDQNGEHEWGKHVVARFAEWYMTTKAWRDAALDKAKELVNQTQAVTNIRQRVEAQALGELGKMGDHIPNYANFANACAVSVEGKDVCTRKREMLARFDRILTDSLSKYQSKLFSRTDSVSAQLGLILGRDAGHLASNAEKGVASALGRVAGGPSRAARASAIEAGASPEMQYLVSRSAMEAEADNGAQLDSISRNFQRMLDSARVQETEDSTAGSGAKKAISSGRATQIAAALDHAQAMVDLAIAKAKLATLQTNAVSASNDAFDNRERNQSLYRALRIM